MAFNGFQRSDDEDDTPTKQPRSCKEMPAHCAGEANNEAAASGRTERTSGSRPRQRADSAKKSRPRRCLLFNRNTGGVFLHHLKTRHGAADLQVVKKKKENKTL